MSRALQTIHRIRRLLPTVKLLGKDGQWLAGALREYLDGAARGMTLERAFGLECSPGNRPWWHQERLRQRDDAIRKLAAQHFGEMDLTQQARTVANLGARYAGTAWRRDRNKSDLPAAYTGTPREHLFRALHADEQWPSQHRIRQILRLRL